MKLLSRGFTLAELMVVVAIIGILSAIAIPSYKKFLAKSRTTEGIMLLNDAYTVQQSIYSEWTTYASCLVSFGLDFDAQDASTYYRMNNYYSVGALRIDGDNAWGNTFIRNSGGPSDCTTIAPNVSSVIGMKNVSGVTYGSAEAGLKKYLVNAISLPPLPPGLTLTQSSFVMIAIGVIKPSAIPSRASYLQYDTWTIDQDKKLLHYNVMY